jgi:hypothetical protein
MRRHTSSVRIVRDRLTDVGEDGNDEQPGQARDAEVLDEAGQVPYPRANAPWFDRMMKKRENHPSINKRCQIIAHEQRN